MVPEKDTTTMTQTTLPDSVEEKAKLSKLPRRKVDSRRKVGAKERLRVGPIHESKMPCFNDSKSIVVTFTQCLYSESQSLQSFPLLPEFTVQSSPLLIRNTMYVPVSAFEVLKCSSP